MPFGNRLMMKFKARDPSIRFIKGIPDNLEEENFINPNQPNLLILDDVIQEANSNDQIGSLFLRGSHHRNLSVILISQNLFHQGKQSRNISLNVHYILLFHNPRDLTQVNTLARQMYPGKSQQFLRKYRDIVCKPHASALIDLKPNTSEGDRIIDSEQLFVEPMDLNKDDFHINVNKDIIDDSEPMLELDKNEEIVDGENFFGCELCGCLFISNYDLEKHEQEYYPKRLDAKHVEIQGNVSWDIIFESIKDETDTLLRKYKRQRYKKNHENIDHIKNDLLPAFNHLLSECLKETLIKFLYIQSNTELMNIIKQAKQLPIDLGEGLRIIIQSKQQYLNDVITERLFKA